MEDNDKSLNVKKKQLSDAKQSGFRIRILKSKLLKI
jgi:HKD family nuclease